MGGGTEVEPRGMTLMDLVVLVAGFAVAFVLLRRIASP